MKWRWPWRRGNGEARRKRTEAEGRLKAARRQTPVVERKAERLAELPDDEFAALVAKAFRRRPA